MINSFEYTYKNNGIHTGLGQVERIDFEDGRYATFTYDALERLTTEHYLTPQATTLFRHDYTYDDDGNRLSKKYDNNASKVVWFSDETGRTTIDDDFGPSNQLKRMWTQGSNTTGTKYTVCGSFVEENLDTIEVVSETSGDATVDTVTAEIRDGLFIARAVEFVDGGNTATKATATATDLAGRTAADTETGIDLDTSIDVWYTYDAAGRREYKYEEGSHQDGEPFTHYYWNDAGLLEQVDIDYGTGETPRYARGWLTWSPTGQLVKIEIRVGSVLGDLTPGSGGTLVLLNKYGYFGGSVIVEREEVGDPSEKEYVSAAGKYLYQVDADNNYWYYGYNGVGSVAAITDASKAITALYEYDAFGNKLTNAGTVENDFGFYGGTLFERFGLFHKGRGRFYEPETGLRISAVRNHKTSTVVPVLALAGLTGFGILIGACMPGRGKVRHICLGGLGGMLIAISLFFLAAGCESKGGGGNDGGGNDGGEVTLWPPHEQDPRVNFPEEYANVKKALCLLREMGLENIYDVDYTIFVCHTDPFGRAGCTFFTVNPDRQPGVNIFAAGLDPIAIAVTILHEQYHFPVGPAFGKKHELIENSAQTLFETKRKVLELRTDGGCCTSQRKYKLLSEWGRITIKCEINTCDDAHFLERGSHP